MKALGAPRWRSPRAHTLRARTGTPGAQGHRAASGVVFAAGASGSPLLEDRRQLRPGGGDEEEEPEEGQEYYGKGAATVAAVHGELLVGASGLGNNEPGGRRVVLWTFATAAVCIWDERDRCSTTPIRSQQRKGHRRFGTPSACRSHRCPVVSGHCVVPLATLGATA